MVEIWKDNKGNTIELHTLKTNTHDAVRLKELDSLKSDQFYFYLFLLRGLTLIEIHIPKRLYR